MQKLAKAGYKDINVIDIGKAIENGEEMASFLSIHCRSPSLHSISSPVKPSAVNRQGSPALEDLKSLEAQGVEIMSCGTCLDYYGLKDKLVVGNVTNMYNIVETQAKAAKVIKP